MLLLNHGDGPKYDSVIVKMGDNQKMIETIIVYLRKKFIIQTIMSKGFLLNPGNS